MGGKSVCTSAATLVPVIVEVELSAVPVHAVVRSVVLAVVPSKNEAGQSPYSCTCSQMTSPTSSRAFASAHDPVREMSIRTVSVGPAIRPSLLVTRCDYGPVKLSHVAVEPTLFHVVVGLTPFHVIVGYGTLGANW